MQEVWGRSPQRWEILQFFVKKKAFFTYFGQNSYFTAITRQLKSVNALNRINEAQDL